MSSSPAIAPASRRKASGAVAVRIAVAAVDACRAAPVCANLDGADLARRASGFRPVGCVRPSACGSAICRPISTRMPPPFSPQGMFEQHDRTRSSRSSPTRPAPTTTRRCASDSCARSIASSTLRGSQIPFAIARRDPPRRRSTSSSTSRATRTMRRRSCWRSGPRRSRCTTSAIPARSRAGWSIT